MPGSWGDKLLALAQRYDYDFPLKEQDVLNIVFRSRWQQLPPTYNAQGLGTYALDRVKGGSGEKLAIFNKVRHHSGPLLGLSAVTHRNA